MIRGLSLFVAILLLLASQKVAFAEANKSKLASCALKTIKPMEDLSYLDEVDALFEKAQATYKAGNLPEAKNLFLKILAITPDNVDANFNIGAICEWQGNVKEALKYYKKAHELKPEDREIKTAFEAISKRSQTSLDQDKLEEINKYCLNAKNAFSTANYAQAINNLNVLVKRYPSDAKVYFALAQSLRAIRNFDWAIYCLKMAVYFEPSVDLYKDTLHDLEVEVKTLQEKAFVDTAHVAAIKVKPFAFGEVTESGL